MLLSQRPRLITSLVLLLAASAASPAAATAQKSNPKGSRPNILFIFSDDHATDAIGAYGGRLAGVDPTPRIDQLASEGRITPHVERILPLAAWREAFEAMARGEIIGKLVLEP